MASEVMNSVLECEKQCEERLSAERSAAMKIAEEADVKARKLIADSVDKARQQAKLIIAEADREAEAEALKCKDAVNVKTEQLHSDGLKKQAAAVNAVISKLIEIS